VSANCQWKDAPNSSSTISTKISQNIVDKTHPTNRANRGNTSARMMAMSRKCMTRYRKQSATVLWRRQKIQMEHELLDRGKGLCAGFQHDLLDLRQQFILGTLPLHVTPNSLMPFFQHFEHHGRPFGDHNSTADRGGGHTAATPKLSPAAAETLGRMQSLSGDWHSGLLTVIHARLNRRERMATIIVLALGGLCVALLAGLTGAMPSPQLRSSNTPEASPADLGVDLPSESPMTFGIMRPQLPLEILDALAEAKRLSKVEPERLPASNDGGGSVPGEFEDEPTV